MESLLLSSDPEVVGVFREILGEVGSRPELFATSEEAMARLREWRFDAVVLDCDETPDGREFLSQLRQTSRNKRAVVFALIRAGKGERAVFAMGANFVLEKPVDRERVGRLLRAAHAIHVVRERFRYFRHELKVMVTLSLEKQKYVAQALNLSGTGMMVQLDAPLLSRKPVHVMFNLPNSSIPIVAQGDVVWSDASGRVGVRFKSLPHLSRKLLEQWLSERVPPAEIWTTSSSHGNGRAHKPAEN